MITPLSPRPITEYKHLGFLKPKIKKMTLKEFIEKTGENPIDIWGEDWQNIIAEFEDEEDVERLLDI